MTQLLGHLHFNQRNIFLYSHHFHYLFHFFIKKTILLTIKLNSYEFHNRIIQTSISYYALSHTNELTIIATYQ